MQTRSDFNSKNRAHPSCELAVQSVFSWSMIFYRFHDQSAPELSVSPLPVDLRLSTLPSLICHWWAERSQWSNEGGTAEGNNNCHRWSEWWPFSSSISSSLQQAALCCCRLAEWCRENSFDVRHRVPTGLGAHKENLLNHAPDFLIKLRYTPV